MEKFDFNAPISTTLIFDDSDDETKPDDDDVTITKNEINNRSSKNTGELKIQETHLSVDEPNNKKAISKNNSSKTEATENTKHNKQKPRCAARRCKTIVKNHKPKEKPLDMPGLEDVLLTIHNTTNIKNVTYIEADTNSDNNHQRTKKRKISDSEKSVLNRSTKNTDPNVANCELDKKHGQNVAVREVDKEHSLHCAYIHRHNSQDSEQSNTNPVVSKKYNQEGVRASIITKIPLSESHKPVDQTITQCTDNIEIDPNNAHNKQQLNKNISLPQSQNENDQTVNNCLKEILNTVSEHLIFIIHSYQALSRISKSNVEPRLLKQVKSNFNRTKNEFFDLSYSSVLNIIIPKENDTVFMKNFVDHTVKLANSKSYPYTQAHMEPLLHEMIEWVKRKQKQILNFNINKDSNPILSQQLAKPVLQLNKPPPPYPNQHQQAPTLEINKHGVYPPTYPNQHQKIPITEINKHGVYPHTYPNQHQQLPTTEINKSGVYPHAYQNQHQQLPTKEINKHGVYHSGYQNQPHGVYLPGYENQNQQGSSTEVNKHGFYPPGYLERTLIEPSHLNKQSGCIHSSCQNTYHFPNNQVHTTQHNYIYNQQTYHKKGETHGQQKAKKTCQKQAPVQKPITQVGKNQQAEAPWGNQARPTWENQVTQASEKEITQSWQVSFQSAQTCLQNQQHELPSPQLDISQSTQHFRQENPAQIEANRSISRDSGFMSPLNFSSIPDQLCNAPTEEEQGVQPLITHVTSLNPNISYITDGFCKVCGKTTKTKCLGCYKCYYCSHYCQNLDWKDHMAVCKFE